MDKPRLSVIESEAAAAEQKIVRGWSDAAGGRGRTLEALRERERRFHDLLDALPAAIYTTDARGKSPITIRRRSISGDAARCSAAANGAGPGSCSGRTAGRCRTTSVRWRRPCAGSARSGAWKAYAERPDGTRVPFIPYPNPLYDVSGTLVGAVNIYARPADVTLRYDPDGLRARLVVPLPR